MTQTQKGSTIDQVLKEVTAAEGTALSTGPVFQEDQPDLHPSLEKMKALLAGKRFFRRSYTKDMIARLKREFSLEDLEQFNASSGR